MRLYLLSFFILFSILTPRLEGAALENNEVKEMSVSDIKKFFVSGFSRSDIDQPIPEEVLSMIAEYFNFSSASVSAYAIIKGVEEKVKDQLELNNPKVTVQYIGDFNLFSIFEEGPKKYSLQDLKKASGSCKRYEEILKLFFSNAFIFHNELYNETEEIEIDISGQQLKLKYYAKSSFMRSNFFTMRSNDASSRFLDLPEFLNILMSCHGQEVEYRYPAIRLPFNYFEIILTFSKPLKGAFVEYAKVDEENITWTIQGRPR